MLKGNLAPDGCVIKPAAMDQRFLKHSGPALVFDDYPRMKKAVDDENLDITADHVLVLRNAGPQGGPGMPEWGMLPMPKKLLKEGHRDMLRLSDARMSGTSYGACVLHVSPESFVGGPLALLRTGDIVSVDVEARSIRMEVPDEELARRRAEWTPPEPRFERGYGWVFTQAHPAGQRGLRLRFPHDRVRRAGGGAGHLLNGRKPTNHGPHARNPRQAQAHQHGDARDRALQARPAPADHPGRAPAWPARRRAWSARPSRCATCRRGRT